VKGQVGVDLLLAVLFALSLLSVFTAFVDRSTVEVRRAAQYVLCDLAGSKIARMETLLRLSGAGHSPGTTETIRLYSGTQKIQEGKVEIRYNDSNVEVSITYLGTEIVCMGREVKRW